MKNKGVLFLYRLRIVLELLLCDMISFGICGLVVNLESRLFSNSSKVFFLLVLLKDLKKCRFVFVFVFVLGLCSETRKIV